MKTLRALMVGGSAAICGLFIVASCADEGVTHIAGFDPSTLPNAGKDAGKGKKDARVADPKDDDDDDDDVQEPEPGDDDEGDDDVADDDVGDDDNSDDDEPPAKNDAGSGGGVDAGSGRSDGGAKADGGGTSGEMLAACPSSYMCVDPQKMIDETSPVPGKITELDGSKIAYSCMKMFTAAPPKCDPKDVKKSCPDLPNAYCVTLDLSPILKQEICAQKCKP